MVPDAEGLILHGVLSAGLVLGQLCAWLRPSYLIFTETLRDLCCHRTHFLVNKTEVQSKW